MRFAMCVWAVVVAVACGASPSAPAPGGPQPTADLTPVTATADWPASTLAAEGVDAVRIGDLALAIRGGNYGRIHSLLIARNGRLIVEEYFNGWVAGEPHTQQSVSKSVTSLLAGAAIDRGVLRLDDRVASMFPDYAPLANADARKAALTVSDLLTMRSGFDWNENVYVGSPLQQLNDCRCDWLRFVLDWPMRDSPGTRWEYVSGNTILLGGVIGRAAGARLDLFAHSALFGPLGVTRATWGRGLPDGLPHAGGGLALRPRDMAKIAALVAGGGRWQGQQVISAAWIARSTAPVTRGVRHWTGRTFDYGYGWWSFESSAGRVITGSGARGQWIFVLPDAGVAVAVTSENNDGRWVAPVEFFQSHIVPAIAR